jgi:hypothetical protein
MGLTDFADGVTVDRDVTGINVFEAIGAQVVADHARCRPGHR